MNNMNGMMGNMNGMMMGGGLNPLMGASPFGLNHSLMNNQMQLMNSQMNNPQMHNHQMHNHQMHNRMNNQLAMFAPHHQQPGNMSMMSFSSMPGQSVSYSSKVMTFSNDGTGKPQVYEQTSSQVCGPGGVRETKETVRDSRTGLQEIKVGRHINDRGHLQAKKRNAFNGDEEEEEEYLNLEEEELPTFNEEYNSKSKDFRQKYQSIAHHSHPSASANRSRLALTNGPLIQQQPCSSNTQQQFYRGMPDIRPPSRSKVKVKDQTDKKSKKKSSKKPY